MAVQTTYTDRMPVAHAGMIADTSLRQIDGATAASAKIEPGRPVVITSGDNNTKVVAQITSAGAVAGKMVGIAVFSHIGNYLGYYPEGSAVNVMRVGRVWAITDMASAPSAGAPVQVKASANPVVAASGGTAIPGWMFTGAFETQADGTKIAEVEVTIQQIAASA